MGAKRRTKGPAGLVRGVQVWGVSRSRVKRLTGFERHHHIPERVDAYHNAWIGRIGHADLESELEHTLHALRQAYRVRRNELQIDIESGRGSIALNPFVYHVRFELDESDRAQVQWTRALEWAALPDQPADARLGLVFGSDFDSLEIETAASVDVTELIDRLEHAGHAVEYPLDASYCQVALPGAFDEAGTVEVHPTRLVFRYEHLMSPDMLLDRAAEVLARAQSEGAAVYLSLGIGG